MYCPKCGTQNDDKSMYCRSCGTALRQTPGGQGFGGAGNGAAPDRGVQTRGVGQNVYGNASGAEALRELILSPLFLVAAISLSVQLGLGVLTAISGYSPYAAMINEILNESGISGYTGYSYQLNDMLSRTSLISAITSNGPAILICASLWIEYVYARNRSQVMGTTGFTMIRVIMIIRIVGTALGALLVVAACFIGAGFASSYSDSGPVIAGVAVVIIVSAAVCALMIIYYLKILKMLDSAVNMITRDRKTVPASMFVIVLTFVSAGLQVLSAFGSLAGRSPMAVLSNGAGAAAGIAFGLLMQKYNQLRDGSGASPGLVNMRLTPGRINPDQVNMPCTPFGGDPAPANVPPYTPGSVPPAPEGDPGVPPAPSMDQPVQIPYYNMFPKPDTVVVQDENDLLMRRRFADEGTLVLSEDQNVPPARLVHAGDHQEIKITKPLFTIGKGYGKVDYFVENNPAVSRQHARIEYRDGSFFIVDMNSTNHVFVDGQMIQAQTPVQIRDGQIIRLADEVYTFRES